MLLPSFFSSDSGLVRMHDVLDYSIQCWRSLAHTCTSVTLYIVPTVPCAFSIDGYIDLDLDGSEPALGVKNKSMASTKPFQAFFSSSCYFSPNTLRLSQKSRLFTQFSGFRFMRPKRVVPPCDIYPVSIMMTYMRIGPMPRLVSLCGLSVCLIRSAKDYICLHGFVHAFPAARSL